MFISLTYLSYGAALNLGVTNLHGLGLSIVAYACMV